MKKTTQCSLLWGLALALTILPFNPINIGYDIYYSMQTHSAFSMIFFSLMFKIIVWLIIPLVQMNNGARFIEQVNTDKRKALLYSTIKVVAIYAFFFFLFTFNNMEKTTFIEQSSIYLSMASTLFFSTLIPTIALTYAMFEHLKRLS